nr:glycoside hydrolase family 16 protein [Geodermatophilus normandii]
MTGSADPPDDFADDFADDFDGTDLDRDVWVPHYLPQWSSRAATAACYEVRDSCLRLYLPDEMPLWCPDDHPPLRVSGIQSGVFSGPVGSTVGQQPVRPGALVREEQPAHWGWTPRYGRLEMRARATVTPRSMVAWWLVGLEDSPERCGELCVVEVFGDAVDPVAGAALGMGVHPFRDPRLVDDFAAPAPGSTSPSGTPTPSTGGPTAPRSPWTARSCARWPSYPTTRCSRWSPSSTSRRRRCRGSPTSSPSSSSTPSAGETG